MADANTPHEQYITASASSPTAAKSDAGGEREASSDDVIASLLLNKNQKKTFPGKLSLILNNPKHNDVICWNSNGNAWNILDAVKLEKEIIPYYFDMTKFSSFVRQINGWGFRRVSIGPDRNSYFHEMFHRDKPELINDMRRRSGRNKNQAVYSVSEGRPYINPLDRSSLEDTYYSQAYVQVPVNYVRVPVDHNLQQEAFRVLHRTQNEESFFRRSRGFNGFLTTNMHERIPRERIHAPVEIVEDSFQHPSIMRYQAVHEYPLGRSDPASRFYSKNHAYVYNDPH